MNRKTFILSAVVSSITLSASAAPADIPNTFVSGGKAVASEVNANFDAVKDAVDDNDARITSVEQMKQNRVTGTCSVGQTISAINEDGTVSCSAMGAPGFVSIAPASFSVRNGSVCNTYVSALSIGYTSGSSPCAGPDSWLYSSVHLPHGATITSVECSFVDGSGAYGFTTVMLSKANYTTSGETLFLWDGLTTSGEQIVVANLQTTEYPVVNNQNGNYSIRVASNYDGDSYLQNAGLRGCTIAYEF